MKITYYSEAPAVVLADPDQDWFAISFSPALQQAVQVAAFTRGTVTKQLPRDNWTCRLAIRVSCLFATLTEGMQRSLSHMAELGSGGYLKFEFSDSTGSAVVFIPNAVLESVTPHPMGATVEFDYIFTAGKPTVTQPT